MPLTCSEAKFWFVRSRLALKYGITYTKKIKKLVKNCHHSGGNMFLNTEKSLKNTYFEKKNNFFIFVTILWASLEQKQVIKIRVIFDGKFSCSEAEFRLLRSLSYACGFNAQNDACTTSEQLKNNFQKVQKTSFLAPKMVKSRVPISAKVSIFGCILDLQPQILPEKCSIRF